MAHAECTGRGGRRGFTLVEILFSLLIIFLLMGILLAGFHYAMRSTHATLASQTVTAAKMGVGQFQEQFGSLPPLVKDMGFPLGSGDPLTGNPPSIPQVFALSTPTERQFLQGGTAAVLPTNDQRFSIYSLSYYLVGALEKDADGVAGPGFTAPTRDGGFSKKGGALGPFFDVSKNERAIYATDARTGRIELRDAGGVALRYYRWEHTGDTPPTPTTPLNEYLRVPLVVGDPETDPELRSAKWAIVGAGRDGLFGDEHLLEPGHPQLIAGGISEMRQRLNLDASANDAEILAAASKDNVVEVGR